MTTCTGSYVHSIGTSKVAVIQNQTTDSTTSSKIAAVARESLPEFNPNKACVLALFKAGAKTFALTSSRPNPDIKEKAPNGKDFPDQIEASIGGALGGRARFTAETLFVEALGGHLKDKLLLTQAQLEKQNEDIEALSEHNKTMNKVVQGILDNVGNTFAIHTDTNWEMKVITAISLYTITDADVNKINKASERIAKAKTDAGAQPWEFLKVELREFKPIVESAVQTSGIENETEKAKAAYQEDRQVIFNDYALRALYENKAFENLKI